MGQYVDRTRASSMQLTLVIFSACAALASGGMMKGWGYGGGKGKGKDNEMYGILITKPIPIPVPHRIHYVKHHPVPQPYPVVKHVPVYVETHESYSDDSHHASDSGGSYTSVSTSFSSGDKGSSYDHEVSH